MTHVAGETVSVEPARLRAALDAGVARLVAMQGADGSWRGDYGGPLFLLPMYVAAHYFAGRAIPADVGGEMVRYLRNVQLPDGGVPLHADGDASTMFTSTLSYVALRLLGVAADDPDVVRMRGWIRSHGTPLGSAAWGKWILALLNLYDYRGLLPVLPELYLLPYAVPIHPARFWCHARQVYLPAAYLYGAKVAMLENDLIRQLRGELYDRPYAKIPFARYRRHTAPTDRLQPESWLAAAGAPLLYAAERLCPTGLRRLALDHLLEHIEYEDRTTAYHRIGPVNAVLNTIVHVARGAPADVLEQSWAGLEKYLQPSPDGVKMNGYLSTSLWDTAFAVQSLLQTPDTSLCRTALDWAADYVRDNQIRDELDDAPKFYRDPVRGGWPFCDVAHGWPITDCTAEGLKATLGLAVGIGRTPSDADLAAARDFLLLYQNADGGWSTYERRRGGAWLERLNVSHMFSDIMVDYPYVECTSACIQALARLASYAPQFDDERSRAAIRHGADFLLRRQQPDGAWEGAWGIYYTYGTWFGVCGLKAAGFATSAEPLRRAARFLLDRQQADGGWGEHYLSGYERRYITRLPSLVVNTAWALLTLVDCGLARTPAAARAAELLVSQQQPDGDWPREPMTGIFNRTTCINYENYRRYFPVWALADYAKAI